MQIVLLDCDSLHVWLSWSLCHAETCSSVEKKSPNTRKTQPWPVSPRMPRRWWWPGAARATRAHRRRSTPGSCRWGRTVWPSRGPCTGTCSSGRWGWRRAGKQSTSPRCWRAWGWVKAVGRWRSSCTQGSHACRGVPACSSAPWCTYGRSSARSRNSPGPGKCSGRWNTGARPSDNTPFACVGRRQKTWHVTREPTAWWSWDFRI